jgi:hypothetical protein
LATLAPLQSAWTTLWAATPTRHDAALAHEQGRRPLKETKEEIADFLRSVSAIERMHPDPWLVARERLREDPRAELPEFDALLSDVTN